MPTPSVLEPHVRIRRRLSRALAAGALAIVGVLALFGLAAGSGGAERARPAPAFSLPLLGGGTISSADLAGQVAVINVWASWCPPCREEAPVLARVHAASDRERVRFLGVTRNDAPDDSREFIARFGLSFPSAIGDDAFASAFGVRGLPMTFVVAADGTLTASHFGPISEARLRALIEDAAARTDVDDGAGAGTAP